MGRIGGQDILEQLARPGSPDQDLYNLLMARPVVAINVPTTAASRSLLNRQCILMGWSLRETSGTAPVLGEFIDGNDTTGSPVGEFSIPAPLAGASGFQETDVDASSSGGAQANNVTLPGAAGATTFITGFEITGDGATGASIITITVTGILGGTKTYFLNVPAGATIATTQLFVEYSRPIPASGLNTAIVVNVPSFGAGNTNAAVTAHGFQRTVGASSANSALVGTQDLGSSAPLCKGGLFLRVINGSVTGSVLVKV